MPDSLVLPPSDGSSALEHVRQVVAHCQENCRKIVAQVSVRPYRAVGVVGAGIMGAAIAIEHASHGARVVLVDKCPDALRKAAAMAASELAIIEQSTGRPPGPPITFSLNEADLVGCELVIESIVEKRPAKQAVYAAVRSQVAPSAVIASNTSTIPIGRLASGMTKPERFCGIHFCHPVRLRPLVELIPGPATAPDVLAASVAHVLSLGKLPLVVADGPGFVVNRLLLTYLNAALDLTMRGVSIQEIDTAMSTFGMPFGPFELLDEIGLDTALHSGIVLGEIFGERTLGSELLVRLVKAGLLGMKTGAGFYLYPGKRQNPTIGELVSAIRPKGEPERHEPAPAAIVERLLRPMVAEAVRILMEKKVAAAWQIDLASIFGLGFPLWHGGLYLWAIRHGLIENSPTS